MVEPGNQAEEILCELEEWLPTITDDTDGDRIMKETIRAKDLYTGDRLAYAPDLLAIPYDGYDMKGNVKTDSLTFKGDLVGTHTFFDASLLVRGKTLKVSRPDLTQLMPSILESLGIDIPGDLDGEPIF